MANRKVSEATGRPPAELLREEQPFLRPLPAEPVAAYAEAEARVTKICLLAWGGNQYSVPHHLARRKVALRIFEDRLDVFFAGTLVVSLVRHPGKGHRILQDEHYDGRSNGHRHAGLQERFEAIGPAAPQYLKGLAQSQTGSLREQAEAILGLCEAYGQANVHAALERATEFGNYSARAIKRILLRQERAPESLPQKPTEGLPLTVAVPAVQVAERSPDYYARAGRR